MMPEHANPYQLIHGGVLMKIMDNAGGVVAHRHSGSKVVTARVDEMQFHAPVHIGNLVTCHAKMTFVGKSSMEVAITVTVAGVTNNDPLRTAVTAYFTFVALDEKDNPQPVPALELNSDEERRLFEAGRQRQLAYKERRREQERTR